MRTIEVDVYDENKQPLGITDTIFVNIPSHINANNVRIIGAAEYKNSRGEAVGRISNDEREFERAIVTPFLIYKAKN